MRMIETKPQKHIGLLIKFDGTCELIFNGMKLE